MTAIGIDLGTVNSCIAHIDAAGRPVVIRNGVEEETTPSVVYFERADHRVVGKEAKNSALIAPRLVAALFKRDMGKEGAERVYHGRRYRPEEISAIVLLKLAEFAEHKLGEPVHEVVVTVPAYFGVAERAATRRAGEIAGLTVVDVLAEPVAAALAYQQEFRFGEDRHLLVFDLGGGTFDTSVIRVGGDTTVLCTDGALDLGGADWDARLLDHLIGEFRRAHPRLDPAADEEFVQELTEKAETLKHHLSEVLSRHCPMRWQGEAARIEVTRSKLEELTEDLLERAFQITEKTLAKAAELGVPEIDEVILVGGMTRMPAVEAGLRERFGLKVRRYDPDLAVARGAALHALTKSGTAEEIADRLGVSDERAAEMISRKVSMVVPRGFGVKTVDPSDPLFATDPARARQFILHLLPAGTPLPADTGQIPAATAIDNQPMIEVDVWEAKPGMDSQELQHNTRIGTGFLRLAPRTPARTALNICFRLSETGLLTVSASDSRSGNRLHYELQIGGMNQAEVDEARTALARTTVSD
ncbi:Hsp70 family protein [Thermomonospora umbrina]|uniref:Molecular chaperone DnaK (HSP70) n=1 Tax=Thermomonospora umbrina TaxID=111806 RepID=A0A3D9SMP8_9ACTN|nr:Hsp70 family protein [Thermomonospora umbrina]REE97206.1 molecular chaperone DnaK (HSP70) [Thermomonospora umbrina]